MEYNMINNGASTSAAAPFCCNCRCHKREVVFPPGYKFNPTDEELVTNYLKKKVMNEPLPFNEIMQNKIVDVILYDYNPEDLAEGYNQISSSEKECYFFTPRERKYRNGERPNRAAAGEYWKATGADKPVMSNGVIVGYRKALVFYKGKAPKGDKTNWIMHEFRFNAPARKRRFLNDMRLDDCVLCRIYKKIESPKAKAKEEVGSTETDATVEQSVEGAFDENQIHQGGNDDDHDHDEIPEPDGDSVGYETILVPPSPPGVILSTSTAFTEGAFDGNQIHRNDDDHDEMPEPDGDSVGYLNNDLEQQQHPALPTSPHDMYETLLVPPPSPDGSLDNNPLIPNPLFLQPYEYQNNYCVQPPPPPPQMMMEPPPFGKRPLMYPPQMSSNPMSMHALEYPQQQQQQQLDDFEYKENLQLQPFFDVDEDEFLEALKNYNSDFAKDDQDNSPDSGHDPPFNSPSS